MAYTALVERCPEYDWNGTTWAQCPDNVWTHMRAGKLRRIQTPYCERHARRFSEARDASPEYQFR